MNAGGILFAVLMEAGMGVFRQTPEEIVSEARAVLRGVAETGEMPELEAFPGIGTIVAGAAVALEAAGVPARASLEEGTPHWAMLEAATARAIDQHGRGAYRMDARQALTHIVCDAAACGEARSRLPIDGQAEGAPGDVLMAEGRFERLSDDAQINLSMDLVSGARLPQDVGTAVGQVSAIVSDRLAHLAARGRYVSRRLGDFSDYGEPLFKKVGGEDHRGLSHGNRHGAYARLDGLWARPVPADAIEAGVLAHMEFMGPDEIGPTRAARARAMVDLEGRTLSAQEVAVRIEADRLAIITLRIAYDRTPLDSPTRDLNDGGRAWDLDQMSPAAQGRLFREIELASEVPPLHVMRLGQIAAEFDRYMARGLHVARGDERAPVHRPAASVIGAASVGQGF